LIGDVTHQRVEFGRFAQGLGADRLHFKAIFGFFGRPCGTIRVRRPIIVSIASWNRFEPSAQFGNREIAPVTLPSVNTWT
jgi:hypothetical protein